MVLFPAPVLPTTPIFDPAAIRKFKFFKAGSKKSPYRYEKSKAESSFSIFTFSLTLFDRWMIPSIRFLTDFRSNEILCLILTSSCFSQAIRGVLNSLKLILENFGAISYFQGKKISHFFLLLFKKFFNPLLARAPIWCTQKYVRLRSVDFQLWLIFELRDLMIRA